MPRNTQDSNMRDDDMRNRGPQRDRMRSEGEIVDREGMPPSRGSRHEDDIRDREQGRERMRDEEDLRGEEDKRGDGYR
ncbi:hypothetical protein [Streptomyces avermitilis]|uniref:hypothetical protein n=1 Tax=Streptomyces avermitilis TaxID=33903 RepID=UPI00382D8400